MSNNKPAETLLEALAKEIKEISAEREIFAPEDILAIINEREENDPVYERTITLADVIAAQKL